MWLKLWFTREVDGCCPWPQFLKPWFSSLPRPPSVQWLVPWEESPGRWTVLTTTSQWTSLSVIRTRSLQQSRSVLPPPALLSTSVSASMTSPMVIRKTQDAILATAAGMCRQQTTSGGLDPGAQYVQYVIFGEMYRSVLSCGRLFLDIPVRNLHYLSCSGIFIDSKTCLFYVWTSKVYNKMSSWRPVCVSVNTFLWINSVVADVFISQGREPYMEKDFTNSTKRLHTEAWRLCRPVYTVSVHV